MKKAIFAATTIIMSGSLFVGCSATAEQVQQIDGASYFGWLGDQYVFEIEDFLRDCGVTDIVVHNDNASVTGRINGREFSITSAEQTSVDGSTNVITQFRIEADDDHDYVIGWLPDSEVSSTRAVILIENGFLAPTWLRLRVLCDEAVLSQVIQIMTSGTLLSDADNPLAEAHVPYAKMDHYGHWEMFGA